MKKLNFRPKKSLGQNFLIDKNVLNQIVNLVEVKNNTILEIGPGTGNLTEKIITKEPKKIFVIEKDKNLSNYLENKFKNKIKVINDDILKFSEKNLSENNLIVFGNLPYNISTQILAKWIKTDNINSICKRFVLMFQKEVAERIIAKTNTKSYGRISILASWKMNIKKVKDIKPKSFYPSPKVESTILIMEPKKNYYKLKNPKNLELITNVFFNSRRKMIKKPLKKLFKNFDQISKKLSLKLTDRPQNLEPLTYFKLSEEFENLPE